MPFDPTQPFEVVGEETAAPPAFDPTQPFEPVGPAMDPAVVDAVGEGFAASISAANPMVPPFMSKLMLTKGGKIGDIAAEVVPAVGGTIAGGFLGPGGAAGGGAMGAAAGNALKQAREMVRGERTDLGKGELAISAAAGAIPVPGLKPGATALATVGKVAAARGAQGALVSGASEAGREVLDEGTLDAGRVLKSAAIGGAVGAVLGAGEGALAARKFGLLTSKGAVEVPAENLPGAVRAAAEPPPPEAVAPAEAAPAEAIAPGPGTPPAEGAKPLGLVESAKGSPELRDDFKSQLAGFYEPQSNAQTLAEAERLIDLAGDLQTAKAGVLGEQNPDAVTQAMGLQLVRKFQTEGKLQDAADVLYDMAVKAKTQGQAIQILSTLSRGTPEGMAVYAQRLFGGKLTAEQLAEITAESSRVAATKDPLVKLARQAKLMDRLQQQAAPARWDEKAAAAMNLSMLLNPKTIVRNLGGNVLMATADLTADTITPAIDSAVSVFTGKRTVSGPELVEYLRGLAQPAKDFTAGYRTARAEGATRGAAVREGVDTVAALGRLVSTEKTEVGDITKAYRSVFSSPLMRGLERTMSVVMGGPDRAFYNARLRASLRSQLRAAGAAVPTAEMLDQASIEAARAVYQDRNFISNALREVRGTLNKVSTFGYSSRIGAGQAIAPFVQVPGSMLLRGLEYSPAGFLRALSEAVGPVFSKQRVFNQRDFSEAFGKALVGTGAIASVGYMLNKLGIVTAGPEQDPRLRALEKSMGYGEYKINVSALKRAFQSMDWKTPQTLTAGDVLMSYDWAQPMAFPLAMGADYHANQVRQQDAALRGKLARTPGEVLTALMSGARSVEEQPLLTGLSGFMTGAADARSAGGGMLEALANSMASLPGQYVPGVVRQIQQLMDNRVYETRGTDALETAYQKAAVNIPGLAAQLGFKPKADVLGGEVERYQGNSNTFLNVLVNPAFVTTVKSDPQLRELYDIWQRTGAANTVPGQVERTITINGQKKVLTAPETADYMQFVGRITRDAYVRLMASDAYRRATPEQQAKVMAKFVGGANTAARVLLFGAQPKSVDQFDRAMIGLGQKQLPALKPGSAAR
jgi:hypothetical protein